MQNILFDKYSTRAYPNAIQTDLFTQISDTKLLYMKTTSDSWVCDVNTLQAKLRVKAKDWRGRGSTFNCSAKKEEDVNTLSLFAIALIFDCSR